MFEWFLRPEARDDYRRERAERDERRRLGLPEPELPRPPLPWPVRVLTVALHTVLAFLLLLLAAEGVLAVTGWWPVPSLAAVWAVSATGAVLFDRGVARGTRR